MNKKDLMQKLQKNEYDEYIAPENFNINFPEYLDDTKVMRALGKRSGGSYILTNKLSERILNDYNFIREVVTYENIKFLKKIKSKYYLDENIYFYDLKKRNNEWLEHYGIEHYPEKILNDKKFIKKAIEINPVIIFFAGRSVFNDKKLINIGLQYFIKKTKKMSKVHRLGACPDIKTNSPIRSFLNERDLVRDLIMYSPSIFKSISTELKKDKELTLLAVKKDDSNYMHIHRNFKLDKEILIASFETGTMYSLEYMDDSFRSDPEVIFTAINQCNRNSAFDSEFMTELIDTELLKNKEFVLKVLNSKLSNAYQYIDFDAASGMGYRDLWLQRQSEEYERLTSTFH